MQKHMVYLLLSTLTKHIQKDYKEQTEPRGEGSDGGVVCEFQLVFLSTLFLLACKGNIVVEIVLD